jgi:transglycosylase-like protein with SLT domain
VIAGSDPAGAAGLTQILAETGSDFLGMKIDLPASRRLTARIDAAERRGDAAAAARLRARRREVDGRFDPAQALAATVRYLTVAENRFDRTDLAVASYHMGIGNLEGLLREYAAAEPGVPIGDVVARNGLSWARVYFDSSPLSHATAWERLSTFGDDSETYYWRVLAAEEIMRLYRSEPKMLARLASLQARRPSAEAVLHPPDEGESFAGSGDLVRAWHWRQLQPLPERPSRLHFRIDPRMGALAPSLGGAPSLYRGLRPEALALLLYLAERVHALSGAATPLTVTSTVLDGDYRRLLGNRHPLAPSFAVDTTGFAFDILRRYGSRPQAAAFQYELERLQARNLIAWVRKRRVIHVTVSADAATLIPAVLEKAA